jgi:hypothetical protein
MPSLVAKKKGNKLYYYVVLVHMLAVKTLSLQFAITES